MRAAVKKPWQGFGRLVWGLSSLFYLPAVVEMCSGLFASPQGLLPKHLLVFFHDYLFAYSYQSAFDHVNIKLQQMMGVALAIVMVLSSKSVKWKDRLRTMCSRSHQPQCGADSLA